MKRFATAIGIAALLVIPSVADGISFTWTAGASSSTWSDNDNWNPSNQGYPNEENSDDTVTIDLSPDPDPAYWPALDTDRTIASLSMSGGAQLNTNGHTLTVGSSATIGSSGATINGGGTVSAASWSFSGTVTFGPGTYTDR